jgi:hypothetical protein
MSTLSAISTEVRECELCGSDSWRILHAGDESNCECEGECLRVCDNPLLEDGCDGVAILIKGECDKCNDTYELSDRTNRCGNCGYCNKCCFHTVEGATNGKL